MFNWLLRRRPRKIAIPRDEFRQIHDMLRATARACFDNPSVVESEECWLCRYSEYCLDFLVEEREEEK